MVKDDEPQDPSRACFACQNMDAYWAEKARHDPALHERILMLQRLQTPVVQDAPAVDDEREEPELDA